MSESEAPGPSEQAASTQRLPTVEQEPPSELRQSASAAAYTPGAHPAADDDPDRHLRRFWSERRVPAALVALLAVAAVGLLLYDVAAVRAGRTAMLWRRRLAEELATRPLDDSWLIGGAAAAMLIGVWLFVLAVTPGLRGLLPMRRPPVEGGAEVRAGLDRSAAALVLRDRAMEVPGVQSVRVDVGRHKVDARAFAHFRELDEVREDLDAALADGVRQLGLARQPALSVQVRRPKRG